MISRGVHIYLGHGDTKLTVVVCEGEGKKFYACTLPIFPVYFTDDQSIVDGVEI